MDILVELNGTGFDRRSSFSFPSGRFGEKAFIFGAGMTSRPIFQIPNFDFVDEFGTVMSLFKLHC